MTWLNEGDTVYVLYGGHPRPVRLVSRSVVWGVAHWSCQMDGVPVVLTEARLLKLRLAKPPAEKGELLYQSDRVWKRGAP